MPQHDMEYVPVYRTKKKDDKKYESIEMILVDTHKKFETMVKLWKSSPKIVGFDTETTGLNHSTVDLVGCSLAFDKEYCFYLPFGHQVVDGSPNLPIEYFEHINTLLNKSKKVLYWNKKFDKRIRKAFGHTNINRSIETDLQIMVYNWDTNKGLPALKTSSKEILGWDLPSFTNKFGKNANLALFRPKEVLTYAGLDAVLLLYLLDAVEEGFTDRNEYLLRLDESVTDVIAEIEETIMPMDKEALRVLLEQYTTEMEKTQEKINKLAKQKLNPESPKQVQEFLISKKIDTGKKTATGKMKCGAGELKAISKQHAILPLIIKHRELRKAIGTYVKPLSASVETRFAYKTVQTATGRLSGGTDKKNDFFTHVNIQGIPKPHAKNYFACHESTSAFAMLKLKDCNADHIKRGVKGWFFFPFDEDKDTKIRNIEDLIIGEDLIDGYIVEGFDPEQNVRRAFTCREGDLFVHFDYSAQEIRLPANFSLDPVHIKNFAAGLDPHKTTAIMMFGKENYNGDVRKIAKILNFNLLYGGQKYSIAEKLETTPDKAQEYIDKWWNLYKGVRKWRDASIQMGKRTGKVTTAFKRIRRVAYWLDSLSWPVRGFGERTCINTRVQGTGGDIIRLALIRAATKDLHKSIESLILSIVHDEINFSVNPLNLMQTLEKIFQVMNIKKKSWPIPMDLGVAIGFSWGEMWEFKIVDNKLVPDGEYIERKVA